MINRPKSAERRLLQGFAVAFLLASSVAIGAPSGKSPSASSLDVEFRASYPMTAPPSATSIAGVDLARFSIVGLRKTATDQRAADDGAIVQSWSDLAGHVRVLVHVAVTPDVATARRILDVELHGISRALPAAVDPSLGDLAWADDTGKGTGLVVATKANVEYSVNVVSPGAGVPSASTVAAQLGALMVVGAPTFPAVTLSLPSTVDAKKGGDVRISVPSGLAYQVHAEGAYMAHGSAWPIVRPFAPGPVTVYATIVDELGRVTVAKAMTVAK